MRRPRGGLADRLGVAKTLGVQIEERIDVLLDAPAAGSRERAVNGLRHFLAVHGHALARFRRGLTAERHGPPPAPG